MTSPTPTMAVNTVGHVHDSSSLYSISHTSLGTHNRKTSMSPKKRKSPTTQSSSSLATASRPPTATSFHSLQRIKNRSRISLPIGIRAIVVILIILLFQLWLGLLISSRHQHHHQKQRQLKDNGENEKNASIVTTIKSQFQNNNNLRRHNSSPKQQKQQQQQNFPNDIIHIVNTRFMQDQPHLPILSQARLRLFSTFCLPTMIAQSNQNFLWIIKTDPKLDPDTLAALKKLLSPHPHFYLVGSNVNYLIGHESGAWRGGTEGDDVLSSPIYTGDVDYLRTAHETESEKIVLQTRLDADDGLHWDYVRYLQNEAIRTFSSSMTTTTTTTTAAVPDWFYWCTRRAVEWHSSRMMDEGNVKYVRHIQLCITPGITVGFGRGATTAEMVPQYAHDKLFKAVINDGGCRRHGRDASSSSSNSEGDCIAMVDEFTFGAVRARTPTSAGMMDVELEGESDKANALWKILRTDFKVDVDMATLSNAFIEDHLLDIAIENMKGQCTHGHSCKLSSKDKLLRLIELAKIDKEENGVFIDID